MAENRISATASVDLQQPFGAEVLVADGSFKLFEPVLKKLIVNNISENQKVGVVLGNEMVIVKRIPVALGLSEQAVENHLRWEAGQLVISGLDDYKFMMQRLPSKTPGGNPYYLVILVRRSVLFAVHKLVKAVNLELCDIDVEAFSIIRTIVSNYPVSTEEIVAIIQLNQQYMNITIMVNGDYYMSNQVEITDPGATRQNAEFYNDLIQKEVKRIIFGHRLGQGIDDLNRIYLIGNGSSKDVARVLSESVSTSIDVVNPFHRIQVSQKISKSGDYMNNSERYAAPIGLLLKRRSEILKS